MMQPARQQSIRLIVATLLASVTLCGCDDSDADTTPTLTQATAAPVQNDPAPAPSTPSEQPPAATSGQPATVAAANDPPSQPAVAQPSQPQPRQRTPSARPVDVTFDDIKLELEKDEPFVATKRTDRLEQLDGERIRIRGFILPGYQQSGLKQFVLVRDNMECCFGPGAALFDCIVVEMVGDNSTEFSVRPVAVEGVFRVQELNDLDGRQLAIYHLAGEDVR